MAEVYSSEPSGIQVEYCVLSSKVVLMQDLRESAQLDTSENEGSNDDDHDAVMRKMFGNLMF